ncbi:hypothetical protein DITRI_Ditri09bG0044300 [Diplodiscus trichospermus]
MGFSITTTSIMIMVWTIVLCSYVTGHVSTTMSLELEAKALLESGWWSSYRNDTSQRCSWTGISCNDAGSVTAIYPPSDVIKVGYKFENMNFSCFPNLVFLRLSGQELVGSLGYSESIILSKIGDLSTLTHLDLSNNYLFGELSPRLGNLTQLKFIDFSYNRYLTGPIPPEIENLKNLAVLNLNSNRFNYSIPPELGNLQALKTLDLSYCRIIGPIPSTFGQLTNLVSLSLSGNQINGSIWVEIGKLKNLVSIHLSNNMLIGPLTNFNNLKKLKYLNLTGNQIGGSILSQIENLENLVYLSLSENNLSGPIPSTFGVLHKLEELNLSFNRINGSIPSKIGDLQALRSLSLQSNLFEGPIPEEIGNLKALTLLDLSQNNLSGRIPSTFGYLHNLEELDLGVNRINGSIPSKIGDLHALRSLSLQSNLLEGPIPEEIGNLKALTLFNLSQNQLIGSIPTPIGHLYSLTYLDLSHNHLSGSIPPEIGNCHNLEVLNLSNNNLQGVIPNQIGDPYSLRRLDLRNNNLSGIAPYDYRWVMTSANYLNSSCYKIDAEILGGNKNLAPYACDPWTSSAPINSPEKKERHGISFRIVLPMIAIFLVFCIFGCSLLMRSKVKIKPISVQTPKNGDIFSIWNYDGKIAYEDIITATEDFDIRYCIGTGGYGSVYRAQLPSGKVVALKKLHRLEAEEQAFDRSFKNEIKFLTEIRHRNIVKLHGYCLHRRCMFLIYEYMGRGSLFCILSDDVEAVELDWTKRVNIIRSTAYALSYLHYECTSIVVHRDISSNNILLNSELEAFVSDFGTARILDPDSSNQTGLVGTIGYVAPGSWLDIDFTTGAVCGKRL